MVTANASIRWSKTLLVLSIAVLSTLVAFNNVTDYGSNFTYVKHVLSMDTTFPGNHGLWRRIESDALQHMAYVLIILTEVGIAGLTAVGGLRLLGARGDAARFNARKTCAVLGLALGLVLFVGGFLALGGEWFLMWQSEIWNSQEEATMFATIFGIALVLLVQQDVEDA
jgi:predicted small integral membrane protein